MRLRRRYSSHKRAGLTLVEMLVVLTILAVLAAVAVQATDQMVEQSRFDATVRSLQQIEQAILGPSEPSRTGEATAGFLTDVGRMPASLEELLDNRDQNGDPIIPEWPSNDPGFPCGWRGPYLRRPIGTDAIADGWGRPFEIVADATSGVYAIVSSGSESFDADLQTDLSSYAASAIVSVKVTNEFGQDVDDATISLTHPVDGLAVQAVPTSSTANGAWFETTVGVRLVQAVRQDDDGPIGSATQLINVPPGGTIVQFRIKDRVAAPEEPPPED